MQKDDLEDSDIHSVTPPAPNNNDNSNTTLPTPPATPPPVRQVLLWLVLAMTAQLGWGLYVTLARYLQVVADIPSLALVTTENVVAIYYSFNYLMIRGNEFHGPKTVFMWILMVTISIRRVTNTYATRLTSAINVQTVSLLTPFVVSGLNFALLREPLPDLIFPSIIVSTIGAVVVLLGGETDILSLFFSNENNDDFYPYIGGVILTCVSIVFFSLGFVVIKKLGSLKVGSEDILFWSCFPPSLVYLATSLAVGENWSPFLAMTRGEWLVFFCYVFFTTFLSFYIQAAAIQRLGAPMVSSFMPTRIISTTLTSMYFLDESITLLQLLGILAIFVCLSLYLTFQAAGGWKRDYKKLFHDIKSRYM